MTVVKKLLEKGAKIDAQDHFGRTPLQRAIDNGHPGIVRYLQSISNRHRRNIRSESLLRAGDSLHHTTSIYPKSSIIDPLLAGNGYDTGASITEDTDHPSIVDMYGRTPPHSAAENGDLAVVRRLQEKDSSC